MVVVGREGKSRRQPGSGQLRLSQLCLHRKITRSSECSTHPPTHPPGSAGEQEHRAISQFCSRTARNVWCLPSVLIFPRFGACAHVGEGGCHHNLICPLGNRLTPCSSATWFLVHKLYRVLIRSSFLSPRKPFHTHTNTHTRPH